MKSSPMRRRIAATAARLMAEEGIDDYGFAKRKAARQLGANPKEALPNNAEIEEELRAYHAIFQPDEQRQWLREMREAAVPLMRELAPFRPYLTGSVADGSATRFGAIELQVFADSAKDVELFLLDRRVDFDTSEPRRADRNQPETTFRFDWYDIPVELAVYASDAERVRPRTRERLAVDGVIALLNAPATASDHDEQSVA